ncbi:MAG: DUF4249 domain-containing protein [Cyclobacteriaceae bacterium]
MKVIKLTFFILILWSCEALDLEQNANLVVVEGYLSDKMDQQKVRITRTTSFDNPENAIPITNANVIIQSSTDEIYLFGYGTDGVYFSREPFMGIENVTYQLIINLEDDVIIRSTELKMSGRAKIDSLWFESLSDENTNDTEIIYFPVISSQDDLVNRDFYYYRIHQNGSYLNEPASIFLKEDIFFNGNEFKEEFRSIELVENDTISVELRKISQEIFEYYSVLREQTISISANQNVVPAPIFGNLSSNDDQTVLGFFSVFASDTMSNTVSQ